MAKIDIFAPQEVNMVSGLEGQKIYFYGDNGLGKSYQASKFEKPLLLMAESGGSALAVPKFPITTWNSFTEIVKQLVANIKRSKEVYQTIIIDTVEELVSRCEESVAKRFGVTEVGMVQQADPANNPNGYSLARAMFKSQINLLTSVGFTVIFIGHFQQVEYTDSISGETYKKIVPYGTEKEKGSTRFVRNLCDFVFYLEGQGIDPESGKTIYSKALCRDNKKAFARSRYTQMQTYINPFTAENVKLAIEKAIEQEAKNSGAGLIEFQKANFDFTRDDYIAMIGPYFKKLYGLYPDFVANVIEKYLGAGRKVSSATEDEVSNLANIYGELVDFCSDKGLIIE